MDATSAAGLPRQAQTLGDVVAKTEHVPEAFFVAGDRVAAWTYLKGPKSEPRVDKVTGHEYRYSEGGMPFPDALERPARTILTGEGGISASRFKHIIWDPRTGRLRRLIPDELEELNGFPRGWTNTGMSDGKRAFMMGNALVVGVVERSGVPTREKRLLALERVRVAMTNRLGPAPRATSPAVTRSMKGNRGRDTKPELLLRALLRDAGYPGYRLHWKKAPGRPDVSFRGVRSPSS